MCAGHAPELEQETSFVGHWIDALRPAYDATSDIQDEEVRLREMEKRGVVTSLENLMSFEFVKSAVDAGDLTIHGLWYDISEGVLEEYSAEDDKFRAL
jgi:carbonic anhydrase